MFQMVNLKKIIEALKYIFPTLGKIIIITIRTLLILSGNELKTWTNKIKLLYVFNRNTLFTNRSEAGDR